MTVGGHVTARGQSKWYSRVRCGPQAMQFALRLRTEASETYRALRMDSGMLLLSSCKEGSNSMTSVSNIVVGIFNTHTEAEQSVKELQEAGFDMKKLSIVAKNPHAEEHVVGFYNAGDRIKHWGQAGAFWGGIWGMLFGAAFFVIPGIGPLLVAGPLVTWIVGALEGAVVVGGISAVGAGLFSIGVPKDSILEYELALKTDKFLVMAHGTADDAEKAHRIMNGMHSAELRTHSLEHAWADDRESTLVTV